MAKRTNTAITAQQRELEQLKKDTEKRLNELEGDTRRQLQLLITNVLEGDIANIKREFRQSLERERQQQLRSDSNVLQNLLVQQLAASLLGSSAQGRHNLFDRPSASQNSVGLHDVLQRALRNI